MSDQPSAGDPLGVDHPFDSDYYGWSEDDVEWENPPDEPPAFPPPPDDEPAPLPDFYARETGAARFASLSEAEQDAALGPDVAAAVREGKIRLSDLVVRREMETEPDFISQPSAGELGLTADDEKS